MIILTLALSLQSFAAETAGVILLDEQSVGGKTLHLNGIALREKFVIDVYVAGLYLVQKSKEPQEIMEQDAPRMMLMAFVRDVGADKINKAWMEGLDANMPEAPEMLRNKFKRLESMMSDIKDGESMAFTYVPGKGTTVLIAGRTTGIIEGKDFADAILATWIGPKPGPGKKFKKELLGN